VFIIDNILLAPAKGLLFVFKEIHKRAIAELYDESGIQKKLIELHMAYDLGEIEEQDYAELENQLIERLRLIREYNSSESGEE